MDENLEVVETTENLPLTTETVEDVKSQPQYTSDDIEKARAQEKAKLYPQVEKLQEELALLRQREQERQAKEDERKANRAAREAEQAALKKAQEEAELDAKSLLLKKEQEWAAKLEAQRADTEKAFALLEREREFQELQQYRSQRLDAERENIIPELIDMIAGDSKDDIEQSILKLKEKSAQIFDSVNAVAQQSRKEMVGTKITMPASGPLDNDSDSLSYSTTDISKMSMADYAKNRSRLLGSSNNSGQGLFGN